MGWLVGCRAYGRYLNLLLKLNAARIGDFESALRIGDFGGPPCKALSELTELQRTTYVGTRALEGAVAWHFLAHGIPPALQLGCARTARTCSSVILHFPSAAWHPRSIGIEVVALTRDGCAR